MMKVVRVISVLVAVMLMVAGFAACQSNETNSGEPAGESQQGAEQENTEQEEPAAADEMVIGCAMQGNQSTFVQYISAGMWSYQEESAPDVKLDVVFADDDPAKQLSQIETFISKNVDAIVLNPVDKVQSAAAVDLAYEAGIPVITVNTISDSPNVTAHVGSDDIEAGRMQMERLIEVVGDDAQVAYVNAVLGHSAQVFREKGYLEILDENPTVELVVADTGNWSGDESMKLVENWIQSGKEIDAIACEADCQLLGVITAVENAGLIGEIKLSGMDCVNEILDAIKEGKVDSSIWQDGVGQGANAVRLAIAAASGETVENFMIPYEVCHAENVDHYMELAKERDELAKKYF